MLLKYLGKKEDFFHVQNAKRSMSARNLNTPKKHIYFSASGLWCLLTADQEEHYPRPEGSWWRPEGTLIVLSAKALSTSTKSNRYPH